MPDFRTHEQPLQSRLSLNRSRKPDLLTYRNEPFPFLVATSPKYLRIKRGMDIGFSLIIVTGLMSWLLPILAILIKLDSRGPVFFSQRRIGKNGKPFICHKLRTMLHRPDEEEIPATHNDPRITRIGKFLRLTNLDELPQFWNVLTGEMSIVGPRPHMPSDCIRFSFVISSYGSRHIIKPGITGLAQVKGFHGPAQDYSSIIQRFQWDAEYIQNMGTKLDCRIIWKTFSITVQNFLQKDSTKKI